MLLFKNFITHLYGFELYVQSYMKSKTKLNTGVYLQEIHIGLMDPGANLTI